MRNEHIEDDINFFAVINEDLINLELEATTKEEVIESLSELLFENGAISDKHSFIEDVYLRETEGVTGIGQGIAIPHGKSESVCHTSIAIGRTKKSIEWETLDENPVNFIILFAVKNTEANTKHIKLLQQVAIKLADDEFIETIQKVSSSEELLDLFSK
ncbi:PTS system fructose-specific transporter subunit IIA [Streptococcus varani]|uniref:PTS system fructose-specific transporter subunit IIA n=1 Tax=Streptococcus varani TaxID=1608583 RepID=A0A0E4H330_9STRE|nr:fructose PTS transporter subunit IIA [Streptococcus varani]CQR23725.1 PTS system fructose-specific transporter subunit IIA [Streptococcus varani]